MKLLTNHEPNIHLLEGKKDKNNNIFQFLLIVLPAANVSEKNHKKYM